MSSVRIPTFLLVFGLLALALPEYALGQDEPESVPITFSAYTRITEGGGYTNCHWNAVGTHADPVGNGDDSDYDYPFNWDKGSSFFDGYVGTDPPDWTGVADDIPGEQITFLSSWSSSSTPTWLFEGCDFPEITIPDDPNAYYTPPPNEPPEACFDYEATDELFTIAFDASCSEDDDGSIVSYEWDFGDDKGGSGVTVQHTYEKRGEYDVTLTVRDDDDDDDDEEDYVDVEGPDFQYVVSLIPFDEGAAKTTAQDSLLFVTDSVLVHIVIENTGDFPLESVRLPGGAGSIEVTSEPEDALLFEKTQQEEIARLERRSSDTLTYVYKAVHAVEDATLLVKEVTATAINPKTGAQATYSESESTCSVEGSGKMGHDAMGFQGDDDNTACVKFTVNPAPVAVNSVEDRALAPGIDPDNDGCTTGGTINRDGETEPECTLRAAMQVAAAKTSASKIEFDIPGGGTVHKIKLDGGSLPAINMPLAISGTSQPDGVPIEIDGSGLSGDVGFDLSGDNSTVAGLAFYGFPGTVLALRGRNNALTGSYIGSDWAKSYTSTDPTVTDPLRNGGVAVLVTGNDTRIGGVGSEGNLIIGSTVGIRVDGARDVAIMGNDIGILESPHVEHGIDLMDADRVYIGTPGGSNRISYNLEYGIRIDETTAPAIIQSNEIIRSRKDGILVQQGPAGRDPVIIGGENENEGNTIELSMGAGIRVTGSGGSAGGEAALLIQGNTLKGNEKIGIRLEGGSAVQIGGSTGTPGTGAGNDIEDGIDLSPGRSSWIQGNRVANLDPETGYSEEGQAIHVDGTNNVIGGETPGEGNVVYGEPELVDDPNDTTHGYLIPDTLGFGIRDEGTSTTIQFNMVGTDGALFTGVVLNGTNAQVIENTISGNSHVGLSVRAPATIEGNYIGVTSTGDSALPNGGPGIEVFTKATIGGFKGGDECERPCNVISSNKGPGIFIRKEATGTTIQGNVIEGNGESGIVAIANNVVIGGRNDIELGDCKGPCNLIAGNKGDGIRNFKAEETTNLGPGALKMYRTGAAGANGFIIEGNIIGTNSGIGLGNSGHGIALGGMGSNHKVGHTGTGGGNLIAGNGGSGVIVMASTDDRFLNVQQWIGGKGNQIRGNRILSNGKLAIDLYADNSLPGGDGWMELTTDDRSYGPNKMLNWPYLVESGEGDAQGSDLLVLWTGPPGVGSGTYSLDIYTNTSCRGAMGEAGNYFVSRDLTFPVNGANTNAVRVDVPLIASMPYYSATLTDSEGNTSELSNCRRAGERPQQALQNVEVGIQTLINRLLITLHEEAGRLAGKSMEALDLLVLSFDEAAEGATFEETAALTPGGQPVIPRSTQGTYWEIIAPEAPVALTHDTCLDASGINDTEEVLVLGRGAATDGAWRPFDTRLETVDGILYACADNLSLMQLTLGSGDMAPIAVPTLTLPENHAQEVNLSSVMLAWQSLPEAATYDLQVSLHNNFSVLLDSTFALDATSFTPSTLARRVWHYWRVRGITASGETGPWSTPFRFSTTETSVFAEEDDVIPESFVLEPNYPNPFNPQTTIGYTLPEATHVYLAVYDALGRQVAVLVDGARPAGRHETVFDAARLPSGMYLYRMTADGQVRTGRMMLLK